MPLRLKLERLFKPMKARNVTNLAGYRGVWENRVPIIEYLGLPSLTSLDKKRQRVAVRVQPEGGGARLFLGDVWRSISSGLWHFTAGASNLQKPRGADGYPTRDDAALAMLAERRCQAETELYGALARTNSLRRLVTDETLVVTVEAK